jgi:hypothetical protein
MTGMSGADNASFIAPNSDLSPRRGVDERMGVCRVSDETRQGEQSPETARPILLLCVLPHLDAQHLSPTAVDHAEDGANAAVFFAVRDAVAAVNVEAR